MAGPFIPQTGQELGPPDGLTLLWSPLSQPVWVLAYKPSSVLFLLLCSEGREARAPCWEAPACSLRRAALSRLPLTLRASTKNLSSGSTCAAASSLKRDQRPRAHRLFPSWAACSGFRTQFPVHVVGRVSCGSAVQAGLVVVGQISILSCWVFCTI